MGWIQKLCDVYDVVSRVDIPEESHHTQLVRVGFTKKTVRYEITVAADGSAVAVSAAGEHYTLSFAKESDGNILLF